MRYVYPFREGDGSDRRLLGGKGAGLCEMTRLGLPVPPGFVITTTACKRYYEGRKGLPKGVMKQAAAGIRRMEKETGKKWGSPRDPLLVSVRSGAAISMPGMMDTVLNLGLNDETVAGLSSSSGDERFAWDSYRRFVQLFGKVVFGADDSRFEAMLARARKEEGADDDSGIGAAALKKLVRAFKAECRRASGRAFPSDPGEQLELAVRAVFESWSGERAKVYREKNGITRDIADGTAVNVVAMVFGNMGGDSATGVVFTRSPGDGSRRLYGEYLVNAQGEDVVAGARTGSPIAELKKAMPAPYGQLERTCARLERHYREPQDIEFTIERGTFYLLQTRSAKMNAAAMVRTSVEMKSERLISRDRALARLDPAMLEQLLHRTIDPQAARGARRLAAGIAASPGAASGEAIFDTRRAAELGAAGRDVILVREETRPEDVPAFFEAAGILTSRGGKTSHAAVVARGMGKPCVVGCSSLAIGTSSFRAGGATIREGDQITIDGSTGAVYAGRMPTVEPKMTEHFRTVMSWAQKAKRLGVRANADTPEAARLARRLGAGGIGLCRTERMFNGADRIGTFVEMIMAPDGASRARSLKKLGALQRRDFAGIFRAMAGLTVTIRLLDPPLHEFLPDPAELESRIRRMESGGGRGLAAARKMLARARELAETNPMMGHRGVRVGVTYPEIYRMQVRAVFDALASQKGKAARPQVMVPQVCGTGELEHVRQIFDEERRDAERRHGRRLNVAFGTMIEVVRAALVAGDLAGTAEFFSFGTNDLTQGTFSFSREDVEAKFLPEYVEKEILERNPFQSLDADGVGRLVRMGTEAGRKARRGMEVGICGEHGGDPGSIRFCHEAGLSYVSASPHRIPIAIVAAAQAAIAAGAGRRSRAR
ncbi:Pyruvate, phosphate dikinase [Nitrosopumilaceae archaeon]|nr:pyruvate, phosphate dikinase [Nitrosopumilus sp.]MDA7944253.1 pyruvate, phosphate dikinase [Nitrosopumilus sp.]MDA7954005.1 pyruvate, phosphate dikinase [Nitrosopumilus sp.]MDA7972933.1 pyruvate, phosphate dikinase [Nitrosopumilus sp.]CAI9831371.1 Pyruvate, phosphate dikinase [Nitrosopumilaceae archaeon]